MGGSHGFFVIVFSISATFAFFAVFLNVFQCKLDLESAKTRHKTQQCGWHLGYLACAATADGGHGWR